MRRIFSFATIFAAVVLLFCVASTPAQETPPEKAPPFTASLMLIKANWSQSPAAKEIEADFRAALSAEGATAVAKLPPLNPTALFPTDAASIFSREHYAQLLAWFKKRQLLESAEPFAERTFAAGSFGDGPRKPLLHLEKPTDIFGIEAIPPLQNDLLFTRISKFEWEVYDWNGLYINRNLRHYEKARGETEFKPLKPENRDSCVAKIQPLEEGYVALVSGFPASGDSAFRDEMTKNKKLIALIAIEQTATPFAATPTTEAQLRLPDKVERVEANRSFTTSSSGGFFGGISPAASSTGAAAPRPRYIDGGNIMVSWSADKDVVWGYSKSLGKWVKQVLDPPAKDAPGPVVDQDVTGWQVGSTIYAFSGKAGRWDVLRLPADHKPRFFVSQGIAIVHDGEDVYTFSAATGQWSSPTGNRAAMASASAEAGGQLGTSATLPGSLEPSTGPDPAAPGGAVGEGASGTEEPRQQLAVIQLKYMSAASAGNIIRHTFGVSATSDQRTNTLIVRTDSRTHDLIKHLLTEIDREVPAATMASTNEWSAGNASGEKPQELAAKYEAKEREAQGLAKQLRELQTAPKEHAGPMKDLSAQLSRVVGEAFAARQQLHQAEIGQLQQRIAGIQQTLKTRDRLSKEIIAKRVKDLLNPDLQWETDTKVAVQGGPSWASPAAPRKAEISENKSDAQLSSDETDELSAEDNSLIQEVLGIMVTPATQEHLQDLRYAGGAIVSPWIRPGSPADGRSPLRGGDIIVKLGEWEVTSPKRLAFILKQPFTIRSPRGSSGRGGSPASHESAVVEILRGKGDKRVIVQNTLEFPAESLPARKTSVAQRQYWLPEAERILAALGLTVQRLTLEDGAGAPYVGAMKITLITKGAAEAIKKSNPNAELAVGDIIAGMQTTTSRVVLMIDRGSERFSVTIDLPQPPPGASPPSSSRNTAAPSDSSMPTSKLDAVAARAVRDKQRERWAQVEKIFEFGRVDPAEMMQAAKDVNEAEVAAAASANEKREAVQGAVERLKRIKSIVDAKVAEGAEPGWRKLGVDAEMLKAEAELAASEQQSSVSLRAAGEERAAAKADSEAALTATRAYRDVLRQRVELLKRGYQAGEFPYSDFMRAMIELDDAEIAAGATAQERQAARKVKLDHIKEAATVVERKVKSGEATHVDLLGAQAEVLKAEAEFAAESSAEATAVPKEAPKTGSRPPREW